MDKSQADPASTSRWLPFIEKIEEEYDALASTTKHRGIGGIRHQQIQLLLHNHAMRLGYGVEIEQQLTGSRQMVDVGIRGYGVRIACEIPISTKYNEYPNIRKCLDAGYEYVASVALDRATLDIVKRGCSGLLTPTETSRVRFLFPEELFKLLEELKQRQGTTETTVREVRGWKVRTVYVQISESEMQQ